MNREDYVREHFPKVTCGASPCGNQVMVQLRTLKSKSLGGIVLAKDTKDFNDGNTQVAMIVSLGHIAFKHRETGEEWKEGAWAQVGDIVVMPRYGGFRFSLPIPDSDDKAIFCIFADYEVKLVINQNFEAFDRLL